MCGIAGVVYRDNASEVSEELLTRMTRTMTHRGPDDEGYCFDGSVGLGHRRLSIIDVKGGRQPMWNEDQSVAVTYNGEIYNYQSLTEELQKQGHRFSTHSDTETIVHAYEEYGSGCVHKFRGMYAFAVWDRGRKQLFLARDRIGKKPLYYYCDGKVFLFASEIKALLASGLVERRVNIPLIDPYLSLGYVPGGQTLFKGISKLEPGQTLLLRQCASPVTARYWDIDDIETVDCSFTEAVDKFGKLLLECVRIRLMSEVPLGVFLSGGLDSTTILALMSESVRGPIKTFSVGYEDDQEASELRYAQIVAEAFGTEHHRFYLSAEDLFESIDTLLEHVEEPLTESAAIALYKLAQLAKPHATVLLSGEGADELLAGYPMYQRMRTIECINRMVRVVGPRVWGGVVSIVPVNEKAGQYLEWVGVPFEKRFRSLSYDLPDRTRQRMYTLEFQKSTDGVLEQLFRDVHARVQNKSILRRMLYIDTKTWLPDDLLLKADKMTMAASIELRAPFLDQSLVEFSTSLPDEFKLRGKIGKWIVRELMQRKIPREILEREKKGFPVPVTKWFREGLHQPAKELLLSERALERGYFRRTYIEQLFGRIRRGEDLGRRVFSLTVLELWHRKYMDS